MIYVTSDLHGCPPAVLQMLLSQADFSDEDYLFVLGDVIDRGEHGAELLLWLTQQPNIQLILGNHEALMLACSFLFEEVTEQNLDALSLQNIRLVQNWVDNGGASTLKGLQRLLKQDPEVVWGILDYLREAPLYETLDANGRNFILVHSGLGNYHPDRPLASYSPEELLLERPSTQTQYSTHSHVIFGHTPTYLLAEQFGGRAIRTQTWTCIDTGASFGYAPMLLRLEDMQEFYLPQSSNL